MLSTADGTAKLAGDPAARDFVTDAYAHCKFIGYTTEASGLFQAVGLADLIDDGFIQLDRGDAPAEFLQTCRAVRHWAREKAPA